VGLLCVIVFRAAAHLLDALFPPFSFEGRFRLFHSTMIHLVSPYCYPILQYFQHIPTRFAQRMVALLMCCITLFSFNNLHSQTRLNAAWKLTNKGLPDTNTIVREFAVSGKTLFCAVFGAGVYRSLDNGATWKAANKGLKNFDIWSLFTHKSTLFAATTKGLFRSADNAQTWAKTSLGADIHSVGIVDKTTLAGSLDSIMISTDNQKTWKTTYRGNQNWFIKSLITSNNAVFAGTSGGILRSLDGGMTWQAANAGFRYPLDVWALVVNNGVVFAATADGVYQSTNNGEMWQPTSNRENTRSLVVVNGLLYAGAIGAVLRSQDNGATWQIAQEGLPNLNIWCLAVIGKTMFAGTTQGIYVGEEALLFGKPPAQTSSSGERILAEPLLRATALNTSNGDLSAEEPLSKIRIEEFLSDKVHSLLNYIFFDENATFVPLRYKQITPQQMKEFQPERLINRETLEVYYDILNIIGYRMQQNTRATLTIVGCNAQSGFETQVPDLSLRRAQAVQQYLATIWRISSSRLLVEFRDLPEKPSKQNETFGDQENRRVELYGSWEIMRPVQYTDTLREISPVMIRFRPHLLDTAGVVRWKLSVEQGTRSLRKWTGNGNTLPNVVDWHIGRKQLTFTSDTTPVLCQLEVQYKYQAKAALSRTITLPIERVSSEVKRTTKRPDMRKNRYNLILFDIGSDKLSGVNERIVTSIQATNVFSSTANVRVLGYTDMVGADDANQMLSQRRAESVTQTLGITPQSVKTLVVKGRGEEPPLLYENEHPEGRFYCRAVIIELDAPVRYE
jgi:outer membrane protein OmpA-like peptidoglycan-associated protein/photosystem II stability/assembly factor-like uncharacterized protein